MNSKPLIERFESGFVKRADGCWNWLKCLTESGYGRINVNGDSERAHRVAWRLYVGEIPQGMVVCHRCDNPKCVNPDHLFIGTVCDNIRDCISKNRNSRGEKNGHAKLTQKQVVTIRKMCCAGIVQSQIAETFGITQSCVSKINTNVTYKEESGFASVCLI